MKFVNGQLVPPYNSQTILNTRAFLDRVTTTGVAEAHALTECAKLMQAIIDGHYVVNDPIEATPKASEPDPY